MIYDLTEKYFWEHLTLPCLLWFINTGRAKIILEAPCKLQVMVDNPFLKFRGEA